MARRPRSPKWLAAAKAQDRSPPKQAHDWLSRALSRAGVLPGREAERAILEGRIAVNGRPQRQPLAAYRVDDQVTLDGRQVSLVAPCLVLMLHKPKGVVTSSHDEQGRGTVFDVLQAALPKSLKTFGWYAVGRLDRNTTGLLLFTNDERVVGHVTSPTNHVPKRYVAQVSGEVSESKLAPLRQGIELDDGPARPAKARIVRPGFVELILTEGRNHQVKRMLGAVGLPVVELHRAAMGSLELDVPVGALRRLSENEISQGLEFSSQPRRAN